MVNCFLNAEPKMGLIRYGKVLFNQTAILTTEGTIISNLGELDAFKIAFATVSALSDVGEYFGIFENDG